MFDPVEAQTKRLTLSIPPSTKYTIINTNGEERFEEIHTPYGERVQLLDNGRTIMGVKPGLFACALGIRSYSSGIHRIQIRVDKISIVFGIRSRNIPLIPVEFAAGRYSITPSTYGWGEQYTRFINGNMFRQSWPKINRDGHVYTIILNCDEHQLKIINENTKEQDEIEVDVRHAPFPWRFFVELSRITTNRVSLISTP